MPNAAELKWQDLLAYPQCAQWDVKPKDFELLTALNELHPVSPYYWPDGSLDRHYTTTMWLETARFDTGVITQNEHVHLRHIFAPLL